MFLEGMNLYVDLLICENYTASYSFHFSCHWYQVKKVLVKRMDLEGQVPSGLGPCPQRAYSLLPFFSFPCELPMSYALGSRVLHTRPGQGGRTKFMGTN